MLPADSPSSWSWQFRNKDITTSKTDIIRSSCPPEDNVNKLNPFQVVDNDNNDGEEGTAPSRRVLYIYTPPQLCSTLLATQPPTKLNNNNGAPSAVRIILAIHGYGGRSLQEIKKWHDSAIFLNSIILAPQGTLTPTEGRLGWNAIHCCGDPVVNEIDDMGFIVNGVVNVFLNSLRNRDDEDNDESTQSREVTTTFPVIATGFSNGGFMISLLGLQSPQQNRPPWLVGIVPTGGYQYNVELYNTKGVTSGTTTRAMPVMSHHGGRDYIVHPGGCCVTGVTSITTTTTDDNNNGNNTTMESNCPFDIGIHQKTCTSVQSAFEMWSHINGCASTTMLALNDNERKMKKVNKKDQEPIVTCWKGTECIEPTELCIWNNEGHSWGFQFPGVGMAQVWMEGVFTSHVENIHSSRYPDNLEEDEIIDAMKVVGHDEDDLDISYAPAISYERSKEGEVVFSVVVVALLGLVLAILCVVLLCAKAPQRRFIRKGAKRKTSGDNLLEMTKTV
mmetsp:Transcript_27745/g.52276  ORF Transcript_27745/g.52276 Transcript_27745/m.52276 type:complete len:503 (-) Transcript_27745:397-1905(-)